MSEDTALAVKSVQQILVVSETDPDDPHVRSGSSRMDETASKTVDKSPSERVAYHPSHPPLPIVPNPAATTPKGDEEPVSHLVEPIFLEGVVEIWLWMSRVGGQVWRDDGAVYPYPIWKSLSIHPPRILPLYTSSLTTDAAVDQGETTFVISLAARSCTRFRPPFLYGIFADEMGNGAVGDGWSILLFFIGGFLHSLWSMSVVLYFTHSVDLEKTHTLSFHREPCSHEQAKSNIDPVCTSLNSNRLCFTGSASHAGPPLKLGEHSM